jgi:RND family efflux transporter MFP subunit
MRTNNKNHLLYLLLVYTLILPVRAGVPSDAGITAITNPSADVTLSFVQPGRIARVHVKEGDVVKAGHVLVRQDDAVEKVRLAQLEADSTNMANIEAGRASLAQKRVDLQKLETAAEREAATELEVEHARLDVKIAELSLDMAMFEHEQAVRKYEEAKLQIDRMSLKSPIDGSIERVEVETGESVNALDSVVQVVKIDPLWIEVPVPLDRAARLTRDGTVDVLFPGDRMEDVSLKGKIIFIAAVADAGSSTLRVRVEVPNKNKRSAGEHVRVIFSTL